MKTHTFFTALLLTVVLVPLPLLAQDAKEIVRKADTKFNGEKSSYSEMTMTIVRPKYQRSITFRNWAQSNGQALTLVTAPAKEKGQTFLKSGNNLWSWNPSIQRLIKLPPSMMSQGWMGSDFTNDDILKESSMVKDYSHKLTKTEVLDGLKCFRIEMIPLENAGVVWGKIILWITTDEYFEIKSEFYDEDGFLVKTHKASKIKTFDDRKLPSVLEIIPSDEPGNKTLVVITKMTFNTSFDADFFTQQNMKRIK
jgi:outer membrane lipoprotein-sorting protein